MKLKIKKLNNNAKIPSYAHDGDGGLDIYSAENYILKPNEMHIFPTGIASEFSSDYVAIVHDKSSVPAKYQVTVMGGVIDSNYRGEWKIMLKNLGPKDFHVEKGDKIAQVVFHKIAKADIEEVADLSDSTRGEKWAGSSGRK